MAPSDEAPLLAMLADAALLRGLSRDALEEVASRARKKWVAAGATIFRDGVVRHARRGRRGVRHRLGRVAR